MRLPRVRFTVWRMMVAVAVVGGLAGLARIGYQWRNYRERYLTNTAYERSWRKIVDEPMIFHHRSRMTAEEVSRRTEDRREFRLRNVQYHAVLKRKYEYAMWHPWALLSPDPEPPE